MVVGAALDDGELLGGGALDDGVLGGEAVVCGADVLGGLDEGVVDCCVLD